MSDIPLQLHASANVASNKSAYLTFSQAEGGLMRNVPSLRKHINIERCLKNIELLNQPLDLKLIDFDEKRENSCEQYDVTIM